MACLADFLENDEGRTDPGTLKRYPTTTPPWTRGEKSKSRLEFWLMINSWVR